MDDLISRQAAIDAVSEYGCIWMEYSRGMTKDEIAQRALNSAKATMIRIVKELPSAQPKPSEAARDIATIIENEKDMRVIQERNLMYQRGYEDGFREGRTRTELLERFDDDLK